MHEPFKRKGMTPKRMNMGHNNVAGEQSQSFLRSTDIVYFSDF
jgi:hypothetical protein